ncbi:MAG: 30S ribosomal protein S1, partial [Pseudonocardiaceae bacterium]
DDVMVKVIDIDLDRRRISLSLKQANEGLSPEMEFDPTQYGMTAEYDNEGNYIYPEGFDPETNDWLDGYDKQREEWERSYADAQVRFEQHRKQVVKAAEAESEAAGDQNYSSATTEAPAGSGPGGSTSGGSASGSSSGGGGGSLASDEQLAALREKLSGGV